VRFLIVGGWNTANCLDTRSYLFTSSSGYFRRGFLGVPPRSLQIYEYRWSIHAVTYGSSSSVN
jgi:hypothetical protein